MMIRALVIVAIGLANAVLSPPVDAAPTPRDTAARLRELQAERESIEQMPLTERPNRPGHFYGNNVRRARYGKVRVNKYRGVQGPLGF